MRDQFREMTASFVVGTLALVLLPGRATLPGPVVLAIGLAAFFVGSMLWNLAAHRRRPWPIDRRPRPRLPDGALVTSFLATAVAFITAQFAMVAWPLRGEIYHNDPVVTTSSDGWSASYITYYDIPDNAARVMIVWFSVYVAAFVILWPLASTVARSVRARYAKTATL